MRFYEPSGHRLGDATLDLTRPVFAGDLVRGNDAPDMRVSDAFNRAQICLDERTRRPHGQAVLVFDAAGLPIGCARPEIYEALGTRTLDRLIQRSNEPWARGRDIPEELAVDDLLPFFADLASELGLEDIPIDAGLDFPSPLTGAFAMLTLPPSPDLLAVTVTANGQACIFTPVPQRGHVQLEVGGPDQPSVCSQAGAVIRVVDPSGHVVGPTSIVERGVRHTIEEWPKQSDLVTDARRFPAISDAMDELITCFTLRTRSADQRAVNAQADGQLPPCPYGVPFDPDTAEPSIEVQSSAIECGDSVRVSGDGWPPDRWISIRAQPPGSPFGASVLASTSHRGDWGYWVVPVCQGETPQVLKVSLRDDPENERYSFEFDLTLTGQPEPRPVAQRQGTARAADNAEATRQPATVAPPIGATAARQSDSATDLAAPPARRLPRTATSATTPFDARTDTAAATRNVVAAVVASVALALAALAAVEAAARRRGRGRS